MGSYLFDHGSQLFQKVFKFKSRFMDACMILEEKS